MLYIALLVVVALVAGDVLDLPKQRAARRRM